MAITTHWLVASSLFRLHPLVFLSVEDSQSTVILFAVIAPEYIEFFIVVGCCMIFYLRGTLGRRLSLVWEALESLDLGLTRERRNRVLVLIGDGFWDESPRELCLLVETAVVLLLIVAAFVRAGTFSVLS